MVTLANGRIALLSKLGAIEPRLPTARVTSASGSTTRAQINTLGNRPDNSFVDTHWLILPGGYDGSSDLEVQRISAFDQDDGSGNTNVDVYEAFAGTVQSGVTAYISPIHPEDVRLALNNAAPRLYLDGITVPRRYHHLTGSRVWNGFWDYWDSGLPIWWSKSNAALTVAQLTSVPYYGDYGLTLTADGSARYLVSAPITPALLNELGGSSITLHAMIWASGSSSVGISMSDGAGDGDTAYHSGGSSWEEIITDARTIVAGEPGGTLEWRLHVAAGITGYFGPVWTEGGPRQEFVPVPPRFRRGPRLIEESGVGWPSFKGDFQTLQDWRVQSRYPAIDSAGTVSHGHLVRFDPPLTQGRHVQMWTGEDYVSEATSETDVYEMDAPQDELLYAAAIIELKEARKELLQSGITQLEAQLALDWEDKYAKLLDSTRATSIKAPVVLTPYLGPPSMAGWHGPDDR